MNIAIVTGASSGLGVEFALQLEKQFSVDQIWLIARRKEPMLKLAQQLQYSKGVVLTLDLTNSEDLQLLVQKIQNESPRIQLLINNAGYGIYGKFTELELPSQQNMIDLNIKALVTLSYVCIPFMTAGSALVNVSSSASFQPMPYFAVYAASKSFVTSFTTALNGELKDRGIHTVALCPGPVDTEFFSVASSGKSKGPKFMYQAEDVVKLTLKHVKKKRWVTMPGFAIKLLGFFSGVHKIKPTVKLLKRFPMV